MMMIMNRSDHILVKVFSFSHVNDGKMLSEGYKSDNQMRLSSSSNFYYVCKMLDKKN